MAVNKNFSNNLIFNRKSSSGSMIFRKKVADIDISNKYIKKTLGKAVASYARAGEKTGLKKYFVESTISDQKGGYRREELHDRLQEAIGKGLISKKKAIEFSLEAGLTGNMNKRFRKFKDQSEYKPFQEKQEKINSAAEKNASNSNVREKNPTLFQENRSGAFSSGKISSESATSPSNSKFQTKLKGIDSEGASSQKASKNIWEALDKRRYHDISPENN
jgi:hypothetical protein